MEVVMIKTLADAEAAVARIGEGDAKELLVFVMESSTSLVDAAAIKAKLLNDLDGYTFLNPSMAERKKEAEKTVRRCIKSMKERFMVDVFKQVMALDEKIEKLAKKAAAPVRLVERTPAERVGDLVYTLHLDDAPLPNPSLVPLMKDEIYISPEDEVELRVQDEYAQQDYYKFNVQVLQLQKKTLLLLTDEARPDAASASLRFWDIDTVKLQWCFCLSSHPHIGFE
uniref:Uncharacterized protein n=1 Tax=Oryza nivara TaxID=4536 RepID=A0A0E0HWU3_ORYNI